MSRWALDIVLPVYNEAATIGSTLAAIDRAFAPVVPYRLIVAEDDSRDGTRELLNDLTRSLPLIVDSSVRRRGYSRALRDALQRTSAPYVLCVDGDGQLSAADMLQLWQSQDLGDVVAGWRRPRRDALHRRLGSAAFGMLLRSRFTVPVHDPSCSLVLMRRDVVARLLPQLGDLPEGFWWEVHAKAHRCGFRLAEIPVSHMPRSDGSTTRVCQPHQLPGVAWRQIRGLARMVAR